MNKEYNVDDFCRVLSIMAFKEKVTERYNQLVKYFETGEYTELDEFFCGVDPFEFDYEKKVILYNSNKEDKKKLEELLNYGVVAK